MRESEEGVGVVYMFNRKDAIRVWPESMAATVRRKKSVQWEG